MRETTFMYKLILLSIDEGLEFYYMFKVGLSKLAIHSLNIILITASYIERIVVNVERPIQYTLSFHPKAFIHI